MSGQARLRVEMELLSDTIFGSGYSIPGGEDIALCQDNEGWPYLKGSAFKGLLRESVTDYLVWTGGNESDLAAMFGNLCGGWSGDMDSEWNGADDGRKIHFTDLTLSKKEKARLQSPEQCECVRAFTSLENGSVRPRTLRQARCVRRGLRFTGELCCAPADTELLRKALAGVRRVGTMRSRGFGEVRLHGVLVDSACTAAVAPVKNAACIRFRIHTDAPVFMTHLDRSQGNSYETRGYLSGAALRGFVMGRLAASDSAWFAEHRRELLSDSVRFLDAVPVSGNAAVIPTPSVFYADKSKETDSGKELFNVVATDDDIPADYKRAKMGAFCRLDGEVLESWNAHSGGVMRIHRGGLSPDAESGTDKNLFSVRTLDAGQEFEGYILTDNPALSEKISACLTDTLWLGADRYAGFGKCTIRDLKRVDVPAWISAYGFREQDAIPDTLYLLSVSPFSMLDDCGTPCGINEARLAEKLGVGSVEIKRCSASLTEFGGYNRTWGCRTVCATMYERGSAFRLKCDRPPELSALRRVEMEGLGIRCAEGLGQVLFLRNDLFENIRRGVKVDAKKPQDSGRSAARRAKYKWLTKHVQEIRRLEISKSQLGTLQALCEASISRGGDWSELDERLDKNLTKRGAEHGARFQKAAELVRNVLRTPLHETLSETSCADSVEARLRLLVQLFDFSRREGAE